MQSHDNQISCIKFPKQLGYFRLFHSNSTFKFGLMRIMLFLGKEKPLDHELNFFKYIFLPYCTIALVWNRISPSLYISYTSSTKIIEPNEYIAQLVLRFYY